jgi:pimeloyl-ACP methyl ester carboxylesterase
VLLHPIGLSPACWEAVGFEEAFKPTYPGHGKRAIADRPYSLGDLADEIAEATAGALDVVGVSMGGMLAQHLAIRHPRRVRSMLLACTTARVEGDAMLERATLAEAHGLAAMVDPTLARWFTPATLAAHPEHPGVAHARESLLALDPTAFADGWRAIAEHDLLARLPELAIPVTCLAGEHDVSTPPSALEAIREQISGSRFVVQDCAHMVHLERPREFAREVREHLQWASKDDRPGERITDAHGE